MNKYQISLQVFALLLLTSLLSCSGDTSSSSSPSIQGVNLSGTWTPLTLECWDPEFSEWTALAIVLFTSAPSSLLIQGNTASYQIYSDSCLAEERFSVVFQTETIREGPLYIGTAEETNLATETDTQDSCDFHQVYELLIGEEITPTTLTLSVEHQPDPIGTRSRKFIWDQPSGRNRMGFQVDVSVLGRSEDLCFLAYEKVD